MKLTKASPRSSTSSIFSRRSSVSSRSSISSTISIPQTLPYAGPQKHIGTLVVVVIRARHLPDKHVRSKQDPYTKICLSGESESTHIDVRGGQHPTWDAELRFPVYGESVEHNRMMEVGVWAAESRKGKDNLIGQATVDIGATLKRGEFDEWVPLERNGIQRGEVYIEMTFFADSSPPSHQPTPPSTSIENLPLLPTQQPESTPAENLNPPPVPAKPVSVTHSRDSQDKCMPGGISEGLEDNDDTPRPSTITVTEAVQGETWTSLVVGSVTDFLRSGSVQPTEETTPEALPTGTERPESWIEIISSGGRSALATGVGAIASWTQLKEKEVPPNTTITI